MTLVNGDVSDIQTYTLCDISLICDFGHRHAYRDVGDTNARCDKNNDGDTNNYTNSPSLLVSMTMVTHMHGDTQ